MSETATIPITADDVNALPVGSPERAELAARLYRGEGNPAPDTAAAPAAGARPDNVPEKFWDAEKGALNTDALLESYKALESKQGGPKVDETPAPKDPAAPKLEIPEGATDSEAVDAVVTKAGLDPIKLGEKIARQGKLDDADYVAIEALGVPRALIDAHVNVTAKLAEMTQASNVQTAYEMVGGQDKATAIMEWAAKALPEADINSFNAKLAGTEWKDAITVLEARYLKANPPSGEPNLTPGGSGGGSTVAGYKSTAERSADMNDPRYRTDPAFRANVTARMRVSRYEHDASR